MRKTGSWFSLLFVVLLALLCAAPAFTQSVKRDPAKEADLWQQLQARDPSAVPIFKEATEAMDRDDRATAVAGYR